jgi:hypothetical protein
MSNGKRVFAGGAVVLVVLLLGPVPSARAAAPPGRYTVNTDTVVDTATGLTWQRALPGGTRTLAEAKSYCADLSLAGIGAGGWRLPRRLELESIVDRGTCDPSIDATAFPSTPSIFF